MYTLEFYCVIAVIAAAAVGIVFMCFHLFRNHGNEPAFNTITAERVILDLTAGEVKGLVRRLHDGAERSTRRLEVVKVDIYDHTRSSNSPVRVIIHPTSTPDGVTSHIIDSVAGADWSPVRG